MSLGGGWSALTPESRQTGPPRVMSPQATEDNRHGWCRQRVIHHGDSVLSRSPLLKEIIISFMLNRPALWRVMWATRAGEQVLQRRPQHVAAVAKPAM